MRKRASSGIERYSGLACRRVIGPHADHVSEKRCALGLLCRKLDLFGRELVAVDGTRLKAVNSMLPRRGEGALGRVKHHASPLRTLQRLCFEPDIAADPSDRRLDRSRSRPLHPRMLHGLEALMPPAQKPSLGW
jgi:hypothetical protein